MEALYRRLDRRRPAPELRPLPASAGHLLRAGSPPSSDVSRQSSARPRQGRSRRAGAAAAVPAALRRVGAGRAAACAPRGCVRVGRVVGQFGRAKHPERESAATQHHRGPRSLQPAPRSPSRSPSPSPSPSRRARSSAGSAALGGRGALATDRNRRLSEDRFTYYRCASLPDAAAAPVPADLGRYYPLSITRFPPIAARWSRLGRRALQVGLMRRLVPSGRLVEVGPAIGGFAAVMQEAGYETSAIEMDAACCRFLRDASGSPCTRPTTRGGTGRRRPLRRDRDVARDRARPQPARGPGGRGSSAGPGRNHRARRAQPRRVPVPGSRAALDPPGRAAPPLPHPARRVREGGRALGLELALATTQDEGTLRWNAFGWRESLSGFGRDRYVRGGMRVIGSALTRAAPPIERRGRRARPTP